MTYPFSWNITVYDDQGRRMEEFAIAGAEEAHLAGEIQEALAGRGYDPTTSVNVEAENGRASISMVLRPEDDGADHADPWTIYRHALQNVRTLERVGLPVPENLRRRVALLKAAAVDGL